MNKVLIGVFVVFVILAAVGGGVYYMSMPAGEQGNKQVIISISPSPSPSIGMPAPGASGIPEMVVEGDSGNAAGIELETAIVDVDAFEFGYKEDEIRVRAGQKVKLTLKNTGKMMHDWVLEGTDVKTKVIKGGESVTIEFTIEEAGEYIFYCSVGNHRAQGMVGTLVVE